MQDNSSSLTFLDYETEAARTDQTGESPDDSILVSVLGIVGEAGDLATLFKKKLRDGDSFTAYPPQCAEELGDILWYIATVSRKLGFHLHDIASSNLKKVNARWKSPAEAKIRRPFLDAAFPPHEQIPRAFTITFTETSENGRPKVTLTRDGMRCGDPLTDNAHFEDGYRYHDAFHLAYAAVLGWSPVTRKLLDCKRRSDAKVDEVEDGGRASVIEEGIAAFVFQYAEKHNMLDDVGRIDSELLSMISRVVAGLEIRVASAGEWENAILVGYKIFRLLDRHNGGHVDVDLNERNLSFRVAR